MTIEYHKAEYGDFDIDAVVEIALAIRPDAFESVANNIEWHDAQRAAGRMCVCVESDAHPGSCWYRSTDESAGQLPPASVGGSHRKSSPFMWRFIPTSSIEATVVSSSGVPKRPPASAAVALLTAGPMRLSPDPSASSNGPVTAKPIGDGSQPLT